MTTADQSGTTVLDSDNPNAARSTTPRSAEFAEQIAAGWAPRVEREVTPAAVARYAAARRGALAQRFRGEVVVIPAGSPKTRSNDDSYPFRAHSAFAYLTGWGSSSVPDSLLVISSNLTGEPKSTLYFRGPASRDTPEFYANPEVGEFWVGRRPTLSETARELEIECVERDTFDLGELAGGQRIRVVRDSDPLVTELVDAYRGEVERPDGSEEPVEADSELATHIAEMRLTKDEFEIAEMRLAIASTKLAFEDAIRSLPRAVAAARGERVMEGAFNARGRVEANGTGYSTIAASGSHATILHWNRNDGQVRPGDLVLMDAGVERDSYYTADITRTFPVSGRYSEIQRRVHEAVRAAADAAFAVVRPGAIFRDIHAAAMAVVAAFVAEWGLLPVSAEESLESSAQFHRRYMVHGTSHHLGLDVHDCAAARREHYHDGVLREGMIFTIEPGMYFQPDDLTIPPEYRGIGCRIEDNILVTATGGENLSIAIPRTAEAITEWMRTLGVKQ